jgi:hypothetical protein
LCGFSSHACAHGFSGGALLADLTAARDIDFFCHPIIAKALSCSYDSQHARMEAAAGFAILSLAKACIPVWLPSRQEHGSGTPTNIAWPQA